MSDADVRLDSGPLRDLLRSAGVKAELKRVGDAVAVAAAGIAGGDPDRVYEVAEWLEENRARVSVITATPEAMVMEARDHALLYALAQVQGR